MGRGMGGASKHPLGGTNDPRGRTCGSGLAAVRMRLAVVETSFGVLGQIACCWLVRPAVDAECLLPDFWPLVNHEPVVTELNS